MQNYRLTLFAIFASAILLVSLVSPQNVLAQDETPPTDVPAVTDEPAVTEEPVATEEPAATQESGATDDAPAPAAQEQEEQESVSEILDQVPEGTDVIVLNEAGQPEPLVTQAAVDIIVNGDPMWCPAGVLPGGAGCTASFASFTDLIAELGNFTGSDVGAGTIYIDSNYNATTAGDVNTNIVFDYSANELTDLVFQGGWDFGLNQVTGTSTLALGTGSLQFWDWGAFGFPASLTLRDIILDGGDGLYIGDDSGTTTANVTLQNVSVTSTNLGTFIGTDGAVSITDGNFSDNVSDGLDVGAGGNITLNNVTANENNGIGASLSNGGDVSVNGGDFSGNKDTGLEIDAAGNVTLNNVEADNNDSEGIDVIANGNIALDNVYSHDNDGSGAILDNSGGSGDVTVVDSIYGGNGGDGLDVFSTGTITLNNITADANVGAGAVLDSCGCLGAGNINISSSVFNGNGGPGLVVLSGGNVTMSDVDTFYNDLAGIIVDNDGNVALTGLNSGYNGDIGVGISSLGDVSVNNSWIGFNDSIGLGVANDGNVTLADSAFFDNTDPGVYVTSSGSVSVSDSFFGNCFFSPSMCGDQPVGLLVQSLGPINIFNSQFNQNTDMGLILLSDSDITLNNVTANENYVGAVVFTSGNVAVCGGSYSYNGRFGFTGTAGSLFISEQTLITGNADLPIDLGPDTELLTYDCTPKTTRDIQHVEITDCGDGLIGVELHLPNDDSLIGVELLLPNGDSLIVPCPTGGPAGLSSVDLNELPDDLPDGFNFVSGLDAQAARDDLTVSFVKPLPDAKYIILHWNGTAWVELEGVTTEDGMFAVAPVDPGIYVLATK